MVLPRPISWFHHRDTLCFSHVSLIGNVFLWSVPLKDALPSSNCHFFLRTYDGTPPEYRLFETSPEFRTSPRLKNYPFFGFGGPASLLLSYWIVHLPYCFSRIYFEVPLFPPLFPGSWLTSTLPSANFLGQPALP